MKDRELFLAALEMEDPAVRLAHLQAECAGDAALLARVEALLASHENQSQFLNTPVVEQLADASDAGAAATMLVGNGTTQDDEADVIAVYSHGPATMTEHPANADDEIPLGYLEPSSKPESLGRLGHYEVLNVVGRGAFGTVLRAFDEMLHRVVAIKIMAPELASTSPARKRFLREAQAAAAIRHEHVVSIYGVEEKPLPYLVMEFIPGETLQQRLEERGPLDVLTALQLGRQIAEGLAAAHAINLIHRDIKPGNILLETGVQDRVKITDFGLARAVDDASLTQSGTIAGTPMYMAPEQALGKKLDQRADLFSFGSVLYQMVSGRPPFRAPSALAVLKRVAEEAPRPIQEIIPETPQWLCDIIAKLHAKNPDDRYQSAREVADVLADCEAQLKASSKLQDFSRIPAAKSATSKKWNWLPASGVAGAVLLLGVIIITLTNKDGTKTKIVVPERTNISIDVGKDGRLKVDEAVIESIAKSSPTAVAKQDMPDTDGWVQLFNGKDLTGWKFHPNHPGNWEVKDGILKGSTRHSHLFSQRDDYGNFHLRAEVKVNLGGDSGILFRAPFELRRGRTPREFGIPGCYEVEIQEVRSQLRPTGSISVTNADAAPTTLRRVVDNSLTQPDEWLTLEVIAENNHFITRINDVEVASCDDPLDKHRTGHLALQVWNPNTVVQFRKIEIRELLPTSTPQGPLPPTFTNSLGMEFVIVPKGKSWLGGGKDKLGDQDVEISADFYLGMYEVTQEEWENVMGENPSHFSRTGKGMDAVKDFSDADLKRFPVESVSWDQCQLFVAKLNQREKESGWVYRLPKEAEWEYACRGGPMADTLDSAFDFYFAKPTNTLLPEQANCYRVLDRSCKVGSYLPNRLGLFDMHGNLFEWCEAAKDGAKGPSMLAARGGGWYWHNSTPCRAGHSSERSESEKTHTLGLRLARVPSGVPSPEAKSPSVVAPFTDADVQRIAALPAAEQVEEVRKELMRRNPGFDGTIQHKIENDVVTELRIVADRVTDIAAIRVFNSLRALDLSGTHVNYVGNGQLADLSPLKGMNLAGLRRLNLNWTMVGDEGLVPFKDCQQLTYLGLDTTQVSDTGLAYFKDYTSLTHLELGRLKVSDASMAHFKNCKNLTLLQLGGSPVGDAGLSYFKECENLTVLGLSRTRVTDEGLAYFKDCKVLSRLHIGFTKVADLSLIKGMPLKELDCTFRPERDAVILRSITTLEKINGKPAPEFWMEVQE